MFVNQKTLTRRRKCFVNVLITYVILILFSFICFLHVHLLHTGHVDLSSNTVSHIYLRKMSHYTFATTVTELSEK
jgi:hypothetical protein